MIESYMAEAILEAKKAYGKLEVPVGCVIVHHGTIVGRGHNHKESQQMSTAHAEIIAIEQACQTLGTWRLEECQLYVTLEPCVMCAGAIYQSRITTVYFGAFDPKGGAYGSVFDLNEQKGLNHYPEVSGGHLEDECAALLTSFFKARRNSIR